MAKRVTPPLNSKGLFEVASPFHVNQKKVYEVIAIREITDLFDQFVDVYAQYYKPHGISTADYTRDVGLNVAIVSLLGEEGVLHIPDTYIVSYPELGVTNYQHVVLSVSLGAISKSKNLEALRNEIAAVCSKFIGVTPKVLEHVAPTTDSLTTAEAKQLEKVRSGNINVPETDTLKLLKERRKNAELVQRTNALLLRR